MGLQENRIHRRSSCAECVSPRTTFGFAFFGLVLYSEGLPEPGLVSQTKAVKVTDKRKIKSKHSDSEDNVKKTLRRASSGEEAGIVKKALRVLRSWNTKSKRTQPKPPQKHAKPKEVKLGTGSRSELKTRFSRPPFSSSSPRAFFDITSSPFLSIHPLHRIQASSHSNLDRSIVCDLDRH